MAIDQGSKSVTLTTEERTWRINIETAKGSDPVITAFREAVVVDDAKAVISKKPVGEVSRALSVTADNKITVGDKTYTIGELAVVIAAVADMWREEDLAAQAANPVQLGRSRPISR